MTRNYAEEDSVKKGLASYAVAVGATTGDVAQIDADGNLTLAAGNGGSSSFATELLVISGSKVLTDCSRNSNGMYFTPDDLTITFQRGSDLTLGVRDPNFPTDAAAVYSAAGGDFQAMSYFGASLTADAGSDVQRFINYYSAAPPGGNPPSLGSDHLVPLVDALQIDDSCFASPQFSVAPGGEVFANPFFGGAQGVAADTVGILLIVTIWSV